MAMLRVSSYRRQFEEELEWRVQQRLWRAVPLLGSQGQIAILWPLMAPCFEEDNDSLEAQICELEERLAGQQTTSTSDFIEYQTDKPLCVQDQSLCDVEELRRELDYLQEQYEETVQQRTLIQLEREDVDVVTADCLALREQVKFYQEQLAHIEAQHETTVQNMVVPVEGPAAAGREVLEFYNPDITPVSWISRSTIASWLRASRLQSMRRSLQSWRGVVRSWKGVVRSWRGVVRSWRGVVRSWRGVCRIEEMKEQQHDLQVQMREQCGDYEELLGVWWKRRMRGCATCERNRCRPDQAKQPAFGDGCPPYGFDVMPKHNRPKSSIRDPMKLTATARQSFEQM
ncbi:unnamed protein product [Coregonus sp. 'balchen']|nr:unnamed protein product [Coregonus sp. 'balchen']